MSIIILILLLLLTTQIYSYRPPPTGESGLAPYILSHKTSCAEHKVVSYIRCGCYRTYRNRLLSQEIKRQCRETFRSQLRVMKTACPKTPILPLLYHTLQDCFEPATGAPDELILAEDHAEVSVVREIGEKVYKLLRKQALGCDLAPLDSERFANTNNNNNNNMEEQAKLWQDNLIMQKIDDPYAGWMGKESWVHGGREVM